MVEEDRGWVWSYLEHPKFFLRHSIASQILSSCSAVVEVGPGKTSLAPYLPQEVEYLPFEISDGKPISALTELPGTNIGLCILGLDHLYEGLLDLIRDKSITHLVIDVADSHAPMSGIDTILSRVSLPNYTIKLELGDDPYARRTMYIWVPKLDR